MIWDLINNKIVAFDWLFAHLIILLLLAAVVIFDYCSIEKYIILCIEMIYDIECLSSNNTQTNR